MRGLLHDLRELGKKKPCCRCRSRSEVRGEFQNIWRVFLPRGVCSFYHMELDPVSIVGASPYVPFFKTSVLTNEITAVGFNIEYRIFTSFIYTCLMHIWRIFKLGITD